MATEKKIGPRECPHCKAITYFTLHQSINTNPMPAGYTHPTGIRVSIYYCDGCDRKEIMMMETHQAFRTIWPKNVRVISVPQEVAGSLPQNLIKDFQEAAAIETLSPAASAAISRRCLQNIITTKYSSLVSGKTMLKAQVEAVLKANVLPEYLNQELHGIRSIGNNAAHANIDPATNEIIEVSSQEAAECLDAIESLVQFIFVDPFKAEQRKQAREKKFGPDTK